MIKTPMDVRNVFPVRKSKKQKQAFRDEIQSYAASLGYELVIEKGSVGSKNIIIGSPDTAKYLITAHYDTPAGLLFPNLITPCSFLPFLGYQLFVTALIFTFVFLIGLAAGLLVEGNEAVIFLVVYASIWLVLAMMMIGPANRNNANDNTSGVVTLLETAKSMPDEFRRDVCFVLFDLEEAGLIGSSSYAKKHKKEIKGQIVLNCDCVGDGDELMMFPTAKVKKNKEQMEHLRSICIKKGRKSLALREKGFAYYPSDQKNFPFGVGIAAFRRSRWAGLYCDKIHTKKDLILDENNVSFLRDRLIAFISSAAQ